MKPPPFDYVRPTTLVEAVAHLTEGSGDARVIAGGQSLMPMLAFRLAAPRLLVDLAGIPDLGRIVIEEDGTVRLGAMVRWRDIERDNRLSTAHPLLVAAIAHVAHYQIRNRGTVGGSLAHADPAAELPGIAVACDADIGIFGRSGRRVIPAAQFFTGALTTALRAEDVITDLSLPAWPSERRWAFEEFSRRRGDFALAAAALFFDLDEGGIVRDPHVTGIGVADRPIRLSAVEKMLQDRRVDQGCLRDAEIAARDSVNPDDDIHAAAEYRRALLGVLVQRALARAAGLELESV